MDYLEFPYGLILWLYFLELEQAKKSANHELESQVKIKLKETMRKHLEDLKIDRGESMIVTDVSSKNISIKEQKIILHQYLRLSIL